MLYECVLTRYDASRTFQSVNRAFTALNRAFAGTRKRFPRYTEDQANRSSQAKADMLLDALVNKVRDDPAVRRKIADAFGFRSSSGDTNDSEEGR
jgi:hypothetical protein